MEIRANSCKKRDSKKSNFFFLNCGTISGGIDGYLLIFDKFFTKFFRDKRKKLNLIYRFTLIEMLQLL